MASLAPKYGPALASLPPDESTARARLEIYAQATRSARSAREGPLAALAQRLGDAALQALFSARAGQALVRTPLARPEPPCAPGRRVEAAPQM